MLSNMILRKKQQTVFIKHNVKRSIMKFSYYYLPNSLVEKENAAIRLCCGSISLFYGTSLRNKNLYGIYVKVKQTTIAEAAHSVESVARAT